MSDREKVIKGLDSCAKWMGENDDDACGNCPYHHSHFSYDDNNCISAVNNDAIAILKQQEQTINKLEEKLRLLEYGDYNDEVLQVNSWEDEYYGTVALCPKCECKWMMGNGDDLNFCPKCGQAVKWE